MLCAPTDSAVNELVCKLEDLIARPGSGLEHLRVCSFLRKFDLQLMREGSQAQGFQ
jgi:hypothetical protein